MKGKSFDADVKSKGDESLRQDGGTGCQRTNQAEKKKKRKQK